MFVVTSRRRRFARDDQTTQHHHQANGGQYSHKLSRARLCSNKCTFPGTLDFCCCLALFLNRQPGVVRTVCSSNEAVPPSVPVQQRAQHRRRLGPAAFSRGQDALKDIKQQMETSTQHTHTHTHAFIHDILARRAILPVRAPERTQPNEASKQAGHSTPEERVVRRGCGTQRTMVFLY